MKNIIPVGWTVEQIEVGQFAVWNSIGDPLGLWDQSALREHFASLFA